MAVYRTVTVNATLSGNTVQAEGAVSDEIARVTAVSQSVQPIVSSDYADLTNKPEINSHILEGDKSSADLGLASADLVGELKSAVNEEFAVTRRAMHIVEPINLLNLDALEDGYMTKAGAVDGSGTSYKHTEKIPVDSGEIISFWRFNLSGNNAVPVDCRFLCAFDANGDVLSSAGSDVTVSRLYTVPNDVKFIVLSIATSYFNYDVMIIRGNNAPRFYTPYIAEYYGATYGFLPGHLNKNIGCLRKAVASLPTNVQIELPTSNTVKNVVYAFSAKVANFSKLIIGQGYINESYRTFITITTTQLIFNVNGATYEYAHGLNIDKYINVTITVDDDTKATVVIHSNGTMYAKKLGWYGFSRGIYCAHNEGSTLTDCILSVAFKDSASPCFIFGDSYIAIVESTAKWSHWMVDAGYGNNGLINACPGINSADSLVSLKTLTHIASPKYLLWCVGMNDGTDDVANEAPNADWLNGVNEVLNICNRLEITPVFGTIPTVPAYNHEYKNAWIRSSGYRYVDFAKAVNASSDGTWFDGMLSSDNVHPTELGAKALWHQVLCDFPTITIDT